MTAVSDVATPQADGEHWTDAELRAAVVAYRAMCDLERRHKRVSKTATIAALHAGDLSSRSPSSISRRMHNISSVLDDLGMERMRGYAPLTHVGSGVRRRLQRIISDVWEQGDPPLLAEAQPPVRVVPVGAIRQESYEVPGMSPRTAVRAEQALVHRYVTAAARSGRTIVAHEYAGGLRCDGYDETLDVLFEAKAGTRREFARMALGQLLDYRRFETSTPRLAVLLPRRPSRGTLEFLADNHVEVVWEAGEGVFEDTCDGALS